MDSFSCRIFHADFYLSAPLPLLDTTYSSFRGEAVSLVPVIRIFGSAPNGQKACVHVHGVFPYLLLSVGAQKVTDSLLHRLASRIDYALQVSLGGGNRSVVHVFSIVPVEAQSLYGYAARESTFLKVYLYKPGHVKRLSDLLLSGAIMNQVLQPYEAHIPYVLQFLVDYKLYGMSYLHLRDVKFRHIGQENSDPLTCYCRWRSNSMEATVSSVLRSCLHEAPRVSTCELECDAVAADILNRTHESTEQPFSSNPGIDALWQDERNRRQPCHALEELSHLLEAQSPGEVSIDDTEAKLICEFLEGVASRTPSEFQMESTPFGSLSENEGSDVETVQDDKDYCVDDGLASKPMQQSQMLSGQTQGSDDDILTLLLQLASTPSQQTQCNSGNQTTLDSMSVADALINSAFTGFADSSFSLSQMNELLPEAAFLTTQPSEADKSTQEKAAEESIHDYNLPFSQTPPSPSTPLRKHSNFTCGATRLTAPTLSADRSLSTDLLSKLAPISPGKLSIESETSLNPDLDSVFKLLCDHQDDEAESLLMSQALWSAEEHIELSSGLLTRPYELWFGSGYRKEVECTVLEPDYSLPQLDGGDNQKPEKNKGAVKKDRLHVAKGQSNPCALQSHVACESTILPGVSLQSYGEGHGHELLLGASDQTLSSLIQKARCSSLFPLISRMKIDPLLEISMFQTLRSSANVILKDPCEALTSIPNRPTVSTAVTPVGGKHKSSLGRQHRHVSLSLRRQIKRRKLSHIVAHSEGAICDEHHTTMHSAMPPDESWQLFELSDDANAPPVEQSESSSLIHCEEMDSSDQEVGREKQLLSTTKAVSTVLKLISASSKVSLAQKRELRHTVKQMTTASQDTTTPLQSKSALPSEVYVQDESAVTMPIPIVHCNRSSRLELQSDARHCETVLNVSHLQSSRYSQYSVEAISLNGNGNTQSGILLDFTPVEVAPSMESLVMLAKECGIPIVAHKRAYCSNPEDVQQSRTVGEQNLMVRSWLPCEQEEFSAVDAGGYHSNWSNAAGLQHWKVILHTLMVEGDGPANTSTKQCYDVSSLVHLIPAVPPPTLKHLAVSDHFVGALHKYGSKHPAAPLPSCHHSACEVTLNVEPARLKDSAVVLVPDVLKQSTNTFLQDAARTPVIKPLLVEMKQDTSQIDGPSPKNVFGFEFSPSGSGKENRMQASQVYYLTTLSVELHLHTQGSKQPDPSCDAIFAVFYFIHNDWPLPGNVGDDAMDHDNSNAEVGVIALNSGQASASKPQTPYLHRCGIVSHVKMTYVDSEESLLCEVVSLVEKCNPDILVGYNTEQLSWGYLLDRAVQLNMNLKQRLSRVPDGLSSVPGMQSDNSAAESDLYITGRYCLDLWRLVRHEIALRSYTFENVAFHVLHERLPHFSFETLTEWYASSDKQLRWQVVDYYLKRCTGNVDIIQKLHIIERTCEFAKLYGILFSSVLTRGSQFRVESMMLRLAHAFNFVAVSPGVHQRARMAAPECLPLILEPESRFFTDPVLVMDFQSLYPSIIIAHNYCYSTCLGKMQNIFRCGGEDFPFGAVSHSVPLSTLKLVDDQITISPVGVVFVKPSIRKGVLPQLLQEILATRVMVKNSMKLHKSNRKLERMLDARQLGLKLIANVTYGYTAAHFSGRMPCVEIGDSIVSKARQTLQQAINIVNSTKEWGGRVVYGDTDSMFILLKGASKEDAFRIGKEIAEKVTSVMPRPVKLKFEKVYLPCILQAKKRYFGYMFESLDQKEPIFDAKGIETVRRDTCKAVTKILEKSVRILFDSKDASRVKRYVQHQLTKLLTEHVSLEDYIIAKEFRGMGRYRPGACVPALKLAKQALATDNRAKPRTGERVPYVVVYGIPGSPIIDLVRRPTDVLANSSLRLNGVYYATKQILPALDRTFSLLGVNVFQWYKELPTFARASVQCQGEGSRNQKSTLGAYFASVHCPLCGQHTQDAVCTDCRKDKQKLLVFCAEAIKKPQQKLTEFRKICQNCCGTMSLSVAESCTSLDCPIFLSCQRQIQNTGRQDRLEEVMNPLEQW